MTITNSTRLVTYTGNGVTTEFDYTFLIPTGALVVTLYEIATGVEGDPLSDALYSVTGLDDPAGGTVTYPLVGSPLAATHKINVKRDVAATQDLNLTNQSPYFPDELEEQLDRIVMMIQQVEETLDRTVTVAVGSGTDPTDLIADLLDASATAVASAAAAAIDAAAADVDATAAAASAVAAAASASTFTTVPVQVVAGAAKTTPVDADLIGTVETTGPALKKTTWLQAWTNYFKAKADLVYQPLLAVLTSLGALGASLVSGDVLYATAASTLARLAKGADGMVLTLASGLPSWATPSSGSMTLLGTLTMTSGTTQSLTGIAAEYRKLYCEIDNVSGTQSGRTLTVATSSTNGAAYGAAAAVSPALTAASDVWNGWIEIGNISSTVAAAKTVLGVVAESGSALAAPIGKSVPSNTAAMVDAIRFAMSSTGDFDAGSIRIYGVR